MMLLHTMRPAGPDSPPQSTTFPATPLPIPIERETLLTVVGPEAPHLQPPHQPPLPPLTHLLHLAASSISEAANHFAFPVSGSTVTSISFPGAPKHLHHLQSQHHPLPLYLHHPQYVSPTMAPSPSPHCLSPSLSPSSPSPSSSIHGSPHQASRSFSSSSSPSIAPPQDHREFTFVSVQAAPGHPAGVKVGSKTSAFVPLGHPGSSSSQAAQNAAAPREARGSPVMSASSEDPQSPSGGEGGEGKESEKARRFVCGFLGCSKIFYRYEHLKRHSRVHTGERPFTCEECGKAFSRSDNLREHGAVHAKAARRREKDRENLRQGGVEDRRHQEAEKIRRAQYVHQFRLFPPALSTAPAATAASSSAQRPPSPSCATSPLVSMSPCEDPGAAALTPARSRSSNEDLPSAFSAPASSSRGNGDAKEMHKKPSLSNLLN